MIDLSNREIRAPAIVGALATRLAVDKSVSNIFHKLSDNLSIPHFNVGLNGEN